MYNGIIIFQHRKEFNMEGLFSNELASTLTLQGTVAIIASALVLGLFISFIYILTHKKEGYSGSFTVTLVMLPSIVAIIILLIGSNVARAFSLVGAFSLIRFRSAPGDAKDISYAFFALGVGLACGMGYIAYAFLFALILCSVMILLQITGFGINKKQSMRLKIILPEDMNYQNAFDDLLDIYTQNYKLDKVKTSEFGSLYEITYSIELKKDADTKKFIDSLRCRNGNLSIILSVKENHETAAF